MTLMNKPSTTSQVEEQTTMTTASNISWTFDQLLADCKVGKKAIQLIADIKSILVTEDLRYEFMMRVPFDPTGYDVFSLVHKMREEQLTANPMPDDSFLDMFMLNPLESLRQYFKHSITPYHIDRMKQWGIDIKDVMELKKTENMIHFDHAMMQIYCR
ncbi:hypothetical protein [Paenibacillus xylanexedens]|uniref:hypothetical protein n=1 Tax=Paenibacillus xylanexedens TaxID=528191 RepID=UPI000F52E353|nr:hypothetical protein [Paenibacillus xylanexedens]RPK24000.1 hypothetical protein EDO6_04938 [Paenibacillus xylanexedens]